MLTTNMDLNVPYIEDQEEMDSISDNYMSLFDTVSLPAVNDERDAAQTGGNILDDTDVDTNNLNTSTLIHHTTTQYYETKLLKMLNDANTPHYMYYMFTNILK